MKTTSILLLLFCTNAFVVLRHTRAFSYSLTYNKQLKFVASTMLTFFFGFRLICIRHNVDDKETRKKERRRRRSHKLFIFGLISSEMKTSGLRSCSICLQTQRKEKKKEAKTKVHICHFNVINSIK